MRKRLSEILPPYSVGDTVYASDWCYGTIIDIDRDLAVVEFETERGVGNCVFTLDQLRGANDEI